MNLPSHPTAPKRSRLGIPGAGWLAAQVDRYPARYFIAPAVILLLFLTIFPFIYSLVLSFNKWNLSDRSATWTFVGFGNFARILTQDPYFWSVVWTTLLYLVVTVGVEFLLGLGIAFLISQENRFVDVIRTAIVIPMMTTPVVVGLIWRFMYNPNIGMLNYFLSLVGLPPRVWLGEPSTALISVMVADIWEWTPFMILIMLAALQSVPIEPLEAGLVDGASRLQLFRYVVIPTIQPAMVIALLLRTIDSFKTFDIIYVLTQGGPGNATQVLSMYTYKWGFKYFEMGYAAALAYLMLLAVDVFATIGVRYVTHSSEG